MCATTGSQMRILQQIYIYLVMFPCGYVRILLPVVICTVIFVTIQGIQRYIFENRANGSKVMCTNVPEILTRWWR